MGFLMSGPVLLAILLYIAIRIGLTDKLYYAGMHTSLHEVDGKDYRHFQQAYSGRLTQEVIRDDDVCTIIMYTDLLGKPRAMEICCGGTTYHYVSSQWWRRRSDANR